VSLRFIYVVRLSWSSIALLQFLLLIYILPLICLVCSCPVRAQVRVRMSNRKCGIMARSDSAPGRHRAGQCPSRMRSVGGAWGVATRPCTPLALRGVGILFRWGLWRCSGFCGGKRLIVT